MVATPPDKNTCETALCLMACCNTLLRSLFLATLSLMTVTGRAENTSTQSASEGTIIAQSNDTLSHCSLRPQDEFWIISTRHLPCLGCGENSSPNLAFSQFQCDGNCRNGSLDEFQKSASGPITVFYVPGNRVFGEEAVRRGWMIYNSLAAAATSQPIRLVVWSWPSDKVNGQIRDVRAKAARTSTESFYLGYLISQLDPDTPLSFVGYSFGTRVITGALHIAAGAELDGLRLPDTTNETPSPRQPVRAVFMASAMHNYWLTPGSFHSAAVPLLDRVLVLFNSCDPVLKRYDVADKCDRACALGYTGFAGNYGNDAERLRQRNVCDEIGKSHDELRYLCTPSILGDLQRYLLWTKQP